MLARLKSAQASGSPYDLCLLDFGLPVEGGEQLGRRIRAVSELARLPMILLASVAERGDAKRMSAAGFTAYLVKPVKQHMLLSCIRAVLGIAQTKQPSKLVTQHTLRELQINGLRILVADDNAINRKVAQRLLEKAGITVETVANGEEVVQAVVLADYDMVLMDMHMPELDGAGATAAIRALAAPKHKIPIVAMTASAGEADRKACLAAGMDGFVSKPFKIDDVQQLIDQLCDPHKV